MSKGDYIITPPQLELPFFQLVIFCCLGAKFPPVVNRGMRNKSPQLEPPILKLANIPLLEGECTISY